ncbi:hypothetical protein EII17_06600 [Clostridiales bacterium COT073_COT-073]|nr:hypothetical protein EII17_06600 [Clostridiales bacterium COT073_COT-073]
MIDLYRNFNQNMILFLLLLSMLGVIVQTFYFSWVMGGYLRRGFEALILLHLARISLLLRHINSELLRSVLVLEENDEIRWAWVISVLLMGTYAYWKTKASNIISGICLAILVTPAVEWAFGKDYALLFVILLLLWIIRASVGCYMEHKKRQSSITEYSIKEALDAQHSGILFAEKNGSILLINQQMMTLMDDLAGGYVHNAEKFWKDLTGLAYREYQNETDEENSRCMLETPQKKCWQFVRKSCLFHEREIYQVIATDITEQEQINRQLEEYQTQLKSQQSQLQAALENLEELKRQEALSLMWTHVHDVLGQRISILQRELNSKEEVDFERLAAQIDNLLTDLNFLEEEHPLQIYRDIIQAFLPLGIHFHTEGNLPEDEVLAGRIVEIMREAITNGVRHGQAENIYIKIEDGQDIKMIIENDGAIPAETIRFGGGLRSIQQKTEEIGGRMEIRLHPRFGIYVELPTQKGAASV